MHFDPDQISDYWRPCQIFEGLNRLASSRKNLTPDEFAEVTGIPKDNIDSIIQRGILPGIISKEAGFIFLWGVLIEGIEGVPNETK